MYMYDYMYDDMYKYFVTQKVSKIWPNKRFLRSYASFNKYPHKQALNKNSFIIFYYKKIYHHR